MHGLQDIRRGHEHHEYNDYKDIGKASHGIQAKHILINLLIYKITRGQIKLIELCTISDLKIVNGRVGRDKHIGNYTCYTSRGKSTIYYGLNNNNNNNICLKSNIQTSSVDYAPRELTHACSRSDTEACDMYYVF